MSFKRTLPRLSPVSELFERWRLPGRSFPDEASYFESMQPRFVLEATRRSKMTPNDPEQPLLKVYYNQSAPDFDLRELVT
jgi:hypothetical protein